MRRRILGIVVAFGILASILLAFFVPSPSVAKSGRASVEWLSSNTQGTQPFKTVTSSVPLEFPRDLGAHEAYQTEWWYYTGNLENTAGRPFGYELTIFRRGLTPGLVQASVPSSSKWRSNQVYFAHFTVSDIANQSFYPAERFSRGAAGLAGAQAQPYEVWLEDWSMREVGPSQVQLQAKTDDVAIDLLLEQTLPPVLQGDRGYSIKGPEPGNASFYYSIVQQKTKGAVTIKDETFAVTGVSWKDHEYSTSALSAGTEGWDWFSLQFDDGSALMLYGLRQENGAAIAAQSSGTFVAANGATQHLNKEDWTVSVLNTWKSPQSATVYPAKWQIVIPKLDKTLTVTPAMPNQELNILTTYWEGAVEVSGQQAKQPIQGKGYVELTGYRQSLSL
jgi:predicted secreted hydrolase